MKIKNKSKILYIYISIFLFFSIISFFAQFFMADTVAKYSTWNLSRGWQSEISLWNVGIDIAIIITLINKNDSYAKILAFMITILCLLLGINHIIAAIKSTKYNIIIHYIVGPLNILGALLGSYALTRNK